MKWLKDNFLMATVVPLLVLLVAVSYYRFLISYDYLVTYEGDCDPYTESCFVYCEDEECSDPFYYTWMTRKASLIKENCEDDVTSCDFAYTCLENEQSCTIEYCSGDSEEECDLLGPDDIPQEDAYNQS